MVYEPEDDEQSTKQEEQQERNVMHWRDHAEKLAREALDVKRDPQAEDSREQIIARYVLKLLHK